MPIVSRFHPRGNAYRPYIDVLEKGGWIVHAGIGCTCATCAVSLQMCSTPAGCIVMYATNWIRESWCMWQIKTKKKLGEERCACGRSATCTSFLTNLDGSTVLVFIWFLFWGYYVFICFRLYYYVKKVLLFSRTVNIILRRASCQPQLTNKDFALMKSDPATYFHAAGNWRHTVKSQSITENLITIEVSS